MCVQRQLSAVREKERVGGCGEPVLCRIVAVALREESRCTRLGRCPYLARARSGKIVSLS